MDRPQPDIALTGSAPGSGFALDPESPPGIALLSLALRVPGAAGVEEIWACHEGARETISALSEGELIAAGVDPARLADPRYVRARGVLEGADLFDPAFFGFTPREAELLDPQHRLLLEAAWEALESAGIDAARYGAAGHRIGVFAGSGASSYLLSNLLPNAELLSASGWLQAALLNDRDFLASRLAYALDLRGPAVVVQSACSTSLLAVHLACQSLLAGECDLAIAGGSSISVPQIEGYLFEAGGISSSDGHCRPFDARADGTVLGSGVGVAVLARAERALIERRPIRVLIRGTATNNDGAQRVGFTAPGVEGQAQVIAEALALAEVDASSIGYVEAHGSGTALGDPIEVAALTRAFRADGAGTGACALGSAKANHGHLNAAAGIAGLARAVLAVERATIPPALHFETPNPRLDLAGSPFYVPAAPRPWPAQLTPRRAGVSSFGLGGTNVHAVLEQAPTPEPSSLPRRSVQPLLLSVRTGAALEVAAERLADHLAAHPEIEAAGLADVAWTLAAGRHRFARRAAVVARDAAEAVARLREPALWERGEVPEEGREVVFLFPGLGDQYPGMARGLYDAEPAFREELDLVLAALAPHLSPRGIDLPAALFPAAAAPAEAGPAKLDLRAMLRRDGADPAGALAPTEIAQPAVFAIEVALARLLIRWGIRPAAMVGYSLGEYSAACVSGALPLPDAARLVAERALAIAELPPGSMLAVPLPGDEVAPRLGADLSLAATNGPHLSVVSGPQAAVAALARALASEGVSCLPVSTTHAFHSSAMASLAPRLDDLARGARLRAPEIPYFSNVTGTWMTAADLADPAYWSRHLTGTVRFAEALAVLLAHPRRVLLEVGPGATLGALARQHPAAASAPSGVVALATMRRASEGGSDVEILQGAVARLWALGVEIEPESFWEGEARRYVELPTYPFERRSYWIDPPRGARLAAPAAAAAGLERRADLADWFYLPAFRRTLLPATASDLAQAGPWLVLATGAAAEEALGLRLAERLRAAGAVFAIARFEPGRAGLVGGADSGYAFDPLRPEGWAELLHAVKPRRIVHLGGLAPGGDTDSLDRLAHLAHLGSLAHGLDRGPVEIVLAATGLAAVAAGEPLDPVKAAFAAALRVVGQELPDAGVRAVDLLAAEIAADPDGAVAALLAEALAPRGEPLIARRGLSGSRASRYLRSFEPVRLAESAELAPGAPVLITDASTPLGSALAAALAARGARLALLIPPGCPGPDEWESLAAASDPSAPAQIGPLAPLGPAAARRLAAAHRATEVWCASVAALDRAAAAAALAAARSRFGRLAGIVHTAASATGGLAALKTPEGLKAALAPEVDGARLWVELSNDETEGFLAFAPSSLGATGGFGQLELAVAGAFLAATAETLAAAGRLASAPLWDPYQWAGWLVAGLGHMAGTSEDEIATASARPEESAAALLRALRSGAPSLIVSARDFAAVIRETDAVTAATLAAAAVASAPRERRLETPFVAPRTETEAKIAALWSELFGIADIGVHDDFLELGGHSLLAIQVATALRARLEVDLPITAIFDAPTVAGLAELVERPAAAPRAPQPPPLPRVTPPDGTGDWPLSFDQERLWFLDQLEPGSTAYNIDLGTRMTGELDLPAMRAALDEIVRRHAAWRTSFPLAGGAPVQRVSPPEPVFVPSIDLRALPPAQREAAARSIQYREGRAPFAIERGPLVRFRLLILAPREHIFLLTVHHTATDWITFQLFRRELGVLYAAYRERRPSPLPEPPVHFPDFVLWQRDWLAGPVIELYLEHWRRALDGVPLFLELPADRPWPPTQSLRGGQHLIRFDAGETAAWRSLARSAGATSFMVLLAAVAAACHRLSGQERLVLGTPSANRNRPEIESIFGFFITQLAIPIDLGGAPSLAELIARARRSAVSSFEYQDVPFTKLVEALNPERATGRAPVIQAAVLLLDEQYTIDRIPGLSVEPTQVYDGNSRYDLMWGLYEGADAIHGTLEFNSDVFDSATALRLHRHLAALLAAGAAEPDRPIAELPLLAPAERHQLLAEWSDRPEPAARPETLSGLFDLQAAASPDAPALACGEVRWTYRDLDARSEAIADRLADLGAGPETLVAVLVERGPDLVAAFLAVAKAGSAYVPLDPMYSAERLSFLLADSGAAILLTEGDLDAQLGIPAAFPRLRLGEVRDAAPIERRPRRSRPEHLAYAIYTSGSTGRPKGVAIEQRSIARFLAAMAERLGSTSQDVVLLVTGVGFDIATGLEIFLPLAVGARIEVASAEEAKDGTRLAERLAASGTTVLQATPSGWRTLLAAGWQGRPGLKALVGGEALTPALAAELLPRVGELWNLYGPTETTVWATSERIGAPDAIAIGRPMAGVGVYVADRSGLPLPVGTVGELSIGGTGVARGYLGRPDLTAERFVPDPWASEAGARLYRTGDLVRFRGDGRLEFLGRFDHQVKVRGHRIELGEIEAVLSSHPDLAEVVVVARSGGADSSLRLAAYVAPRGGTAPAAESLRAYLAERLPEAFVPSFFVVLAALPKTPNGKVDRKALPEPDPSAGRAARWRAPDTATERLVANSWAEVLGIDRDAAPIGADDSFFEFGGHSLLAAQAAHRLTSALGVPVPVRAFFQNPTVARFAAALEAEATPKGSSKGRKPPLEPADRGLPLPLSFAQERLWFLDRLAPGNATYNLPIAILFTGPLDLPALAKALGIVVARHEALRTVFALVDGRPVQVVRPAAGFRLPRIDLSALATTGEEARRLATAEAAVPFDLERGPLARAQVLHLAPQRALFLLDVHHIVFDAWSVGVLVREATALYAAAAGGRPPLELPPLPVQYGDYAVWQRSWLRGEELERQVGGFRRRLAGAPEALALPTDRPRPPLVGSAGRVLRMSLPAALSAAAFDLARREGATGFMLVLAIWAALLSRWSGERDVVLGTSIANRDAIELEGMIGYFVNTLPLRLELAGDPTFRALLAQARGEALEAFGRRDVPFEKLVEELKPVRDRSRHPIVQTVLTWQNAALPEINLGPVHLEPVMPESASAKFDLTLIAGREEGRIQGALEYARDLFEEASMRRLIERFEAFLGAAVARPDVRLSQLPLLSEAERRELVVERNRTATAFPRGATIPQLFSEQVALRPDAAALEWLASGEPAVLTYGELARRAMRLAHVLAGLGATLEMPIAILAERTPETVLGILGVLAAGGAYVPLDPSYPAERQALLLEDSGAAILLGRQAALDELPSLVTAQAAVQIPLDATENGGFGVFSALSGRPVRPLPESLAYVMYTSGSTGRPKGVWVTHRNVVRLVRDTDYARFGADEVCLLFAPLAFDASTFELWGALANGGKVAIAASGPLSPGELKRELLRFDVTAVWLTAGLFHQMADYGFAGLPALRQLLAGGDALAAAQVRRALAELPGGRLIDGYGPTEGTTFTCCFAMDDPATVPDAVPIGRPIANACAYVLDEDLEPVAAGAWGELYAGGEGIARGYLGRADLTAARFVPDPFSGPGSRLYRTGDQVRWGRAATLEFLGRRDGQVKIRGYRVELAEVESALLADGRVREAAAIAREDRPGDRRLVAYVTLRGADAPSLDKFRHLGVSGTGGQADAEVARDLQARLSARLPEPFVPSAIVVLDRLPLSANGKIDRRALPAPGESAGDGYVAPRSDLERQLAGVAAEVLGVSRVGLADNFFELGGHSLLATRFVAELESRGGISVPLQDVFDARDLGELAERIVERELGAADEELLAELLAGQER